MGCPKRGFQAVVVDIKNEIKINRIMDAVLLEISKAIIPAIVVAILTAYITVKLSMKQFYTQRWWQKKAEVYSEIIQNLALLQFYFGESYDEGIGLKKLSDDEKEKLYNDYKKAKESLIKASFVGTYIVSEATSNLVEQLVSDLKPKQSDFVSDMDRLYGVVRDGLLKLRTQAKEDLNQ